MLHTFSFAACYWNLCVHRAGDVRIVAIDISEAALARGRGRLSASPRLWWTAGIVFTFANICVCTLKAFMFFSFSPKMIITWEQNLIEFGVWEASDGGTGKRWIKKTLKRQLDDKIDLLWFVYMFCRLGKFVPHKGRLSSSKQTPLIWEPWPRTRDHKGREYMCSLQVYHKIQLEKHTALILLLLTWIDFT